MSEKKIIFNVCTYLLLFFIPKRTIDDMNKCNVKDVIHSDRKQSNTVVPSSRQNLLVSFHSLLWFCVSLSPVLLPDTVRSCFLSINLLYIT